MLELRFDHVGVQVRDLEEATAAFARLFDYHQATRPVVNTRHRVRGVFLERPGSIPIKLIAPLEPGDGDQRFGTHHLAFLTNDIEASVAELRQKGARLISRPQPGEMFDDHPIAFLFASGVNVELVTTTEWRDRIDQPAGEA